MKKKCCFTIILSVLLATNHIVAQTPTDKTINNQQYLSVPLTDKAPLVDGIIDANDPWDNEWTTIAKLSASSTTDNTSAKFQLWGGADAFYLAVVVHDATPNNDVAIQYSYERDCSEIYFSMDTNAYNNEGSYRKGTWQIRCQRESQNGQYIDGNSHANTWSVNTLTQSTAFRYASRSMPTEYVQEFVFPYAVLAEGANWDEEFFRFEIDIADNTTGESGGRTQMLFWNDNSDEQWRDTRTFGLVRLVQVDRPVAVASDDQEVKEGGQVTLDGSASYDPGNQPLTYRWVAPSAITLTGANTATPSFTAPTVITVTKFTVSLIVNNGTADSRANDVVVTVRPLNNTPVANAGADKTVLAGSNVTLNGTTSVFPKQITPSYKWTAPAGITLNSTSSARPTFTAPKVTETTNFVFSLVVQDGDYVSSPDEVVVTVNVNSSLGGLMVDRTDKAPVVDGIIDANDPWDNEWTTIAKLSASSTTDNTSAKFQLWGGADAFYLAVVANDATPNNNSNIPNSYERDCSEIYFSMDTNAYNNEGRYRKGTWQIRCQRESQNGQYIDGNSHANTWSVNTLTQSTAFRYASRSMPTEYVQEFVLPYSVLAEGANWDEEFFRFEIDIADNTTGESWGRSQLTFWNDNSDEQWRDTRTFGLVRLVQVDRPVAVASDDQEVKEGGQVTLDGSASYDPGNQPLTYRWVAPSAITLTGANTATPSFTAPTVITVTKFTVSLIVNNGTADSRANDVVVTVRPLNNIPVAQADFFKTITSDSIVRLDGQASYSPQGNKLNYQWTASDGIELSSITAAQPFFQIKEGVTDTVFTFTLVVNDGLYYSEPNTVTFYLSDLNKETGMSANKKVEFNYLIYPNPTYGIVEIRTSRTVQTTMKISVTDLTGRKIFEQTFEPAQHYQLDLTGEAKGLYMLHIQANEQQVIKKLLVK